MKRLLAFAIFALLFVGCLTTSNAIQPIHNSSEQKDGSYTADKAQKIILEAPKYSINYQALAEEINIRRKVEIAVATDDGVVANPRLNAKSRETAQKVIDEYKENAEKRLAKGK